MVELENLRPSALVVFGGGGNGAAGIRALPSDLQMMRRDVNRFV